MVLQTNSSKRIVPIGLSKQELFLGNHSRTSIHFRNEVVFKNVGNQGTKMHQLMGVDRNTQLFIFHISIVKCVPYQPRRRRPGQPGILRRESPELVDPLASAAAEDGKEATKPTVETWELLKRPQKTGTRMHLVQRPS